MARKRQDTIPIRLTGALLGEYRVLVYRKASSPGFMIDCIPLAKDRECELEAVKGGESERKSGAGNRKGVVP